MDFDRAIAAHEQWKERLRQAIADRTFLDERTIGADDLCVLGRWLHGEARQLKADGELLQECVAKHALFHAEAARVASAVNNRQFARAKTLLAPGSFYCEISDELVGAIRRMEATLQKG